MKRQKKTRTSISRLDGDIVVVVPTTISKPLAKFKKKMKKTTKRALNIILAISLIINVVTLSRCASDTANALENPNSYSTPLVANKNDSLIIEQVATDNDGIVTLVATVTPSDAVNKEVDWSIAWKNGASRSNENVNTYLEITPLEDGGNTATVRCLRAFNGDNIIITATTREGGFSATCTCSYVGTPNRLEIDMGVINPVNDSHYNVDIYNLSSESSYDFDLNLLNSFGPIDDSYNCSYTATHETVGSFQAKFMIFAQGTETVDEIATKSLNDYVNSQSQNMRGYLSYSIVDNMLHIEAISSIRNIRWITGSTTASTRGWFFNDLIGGAEPYVKITITEQTSGLTSTINVRVITAPSGVSLNRTTITF